MHAIQVIDALLGKLGLVRSAKSRALVVAEQEFSLKLAKAAKARGLEVFLADSSADHSELQGPVFVFGPRVRIHGCRVESITFAPSATKVSVSDTYVKGEAK